MDKDKRIDTKIPIVFEITDSEEDSRFLKVKIWLMHLGVNYNNSYFSKEVVLDNVHTIKNTPLLGFVEEGKLGKDFKGHEEILIVKDGEITTKYLGSAYGIIPESCNPRFEFKTGDDGLTREYLVVDALMWTKFQDAVEIVKESNEVGQSMEIHDEGFDGYWNENDIFIFKKFKFDGACMLGKDVVPAMQKASVERTFNTDSIRFQIEEKLKEYNEFIEGKYSKEVETVKLEELLAKYSITEDVLSEKGLDIKSYSLEELEDKIKELLSNQTNENQDDSEKKDNESQDADKNADEENKDTSDEKESSEKDEFNEDDTQEDVVDTTFSTENPLLSKVFKKFELSHSDLRWKLYDGLDEHIKNNSTDANEFDWFYILSVYDDYFIAENENENSYFKVSYSKEDDNVLLKDVTQVYSMFLTSDEKGALDLMRSSFDKFEAENKELREFKANVEKEQHVEKAEQLFSRFSNLNEEDLSELRNKVSEYSIEELESKTFEILGRKMASMQNTKFNKKEKQENSIKIGNGNKEYVSSIDKHFEKHGFKRLNN